MARWWWIQATVVLAIAATFLAADAFFVVAPSKSHHAVTATDAAAAATRYHVASTTQLYGNTQMPAQADDPITSVFGEESRRYRRTVFTHDDWVRHRSPDRFWRNVQTFFSSGIYKNIGFEVAVVTAIATFVVIYNALIGGHVDFNGVQHEAVIQHAMLPKLGLPLTPFTLSSPSLGLLLGETTNSCGYAWITHSFTLTLCLSLVFYYNHSVSHQYIVPTLGRSTKELGNEH
jgi:Bestrophin, RFP-TM, chloride channel